MLPDEVARVALRHRAMRRLVLDYIDAADLDFPQQDAVLRDSRRVVCAFGGVRSGKTEAGARLSVARIWRQCMAYLDAEALGRLPVWTPSRTMPMVGEDEPRAHYWVVGPTADLATVAWRKFLMVVRAAGLPVVRQVEGALWLPGGVLVERRTGKDETQLQGARLDGAWVDEVCTLDEASWDQLGNRVTDRGGWRLATGSPRPWSWAKRRLWDAGSSETVGLHTWHTADNPYIPRVEVEEARRTMPARWFARDYEASWETADGLVYDEVDWSVGGNLIDCTSLRGPAPGRTWWGGIDFGLRRPAIILGCSMRLDDGREVDIVVDEAVLADIGTTPRLASALADLCDRWGATMSAVHCDPAGEQRSGQSRIPVTTIASLREALAQRGQGCQVVYPEGPRRSIAAGVEAVASRIRAGDGRRLLLLNAELDARRYPAPLVGMCGSLRGYKWPGRAGADQPDKDGVHDHFCDVLRYAVVDIRGLVGEGKSWGAPAVRSIAEPARRREGPMRPVERW